MVKKAKETQTATAVLEAPEAADETEQEYEQRYETWLEAKKAAGKTIRWQAKALYKAMDLWPIQAATEEEWQDICENAVTEYHSGRFFLEQLGAERYLNPKLFATLWALRNGLVEEYGMESAAQEMLIDLMMIGYYNTLRVQGWVGDLASQIERHLFDEYGLSVRFEEKNGKRLQKGLHVEAHLERFREQMLPLLDRCDRMFIRNLRALQDLKRGAAPRVSIGQAGQVNVANQQVNTSA